MEVWECLLSLECTTKYAPAYMVYLAIVSLVLTGVGYIIQLTLSNKVSKSKNLKKSPLLSHKIGSKLRAIANMIINRVEDLKSGIYLDKKESKMKSGKSLLRK